MSQGYQEWDRGQTGFATPQIDQFVAEVLEEPPTRSLRLLLVAVQHGQQIINDGFFPGRAHRAVTLA